MRGLMGRMGVLLAVTLTSIAVVRANTPTVTTATSPGFPGAALAHPSQEGATTTTTTTIAATTTTTTTPVSVNAEVVQVGALPTRGTVIQAAPTLPLPTSTTTVPPRLPTDLPLDSGTGRRIVYNKRHMRIWLVDSNNQVVKTHAVSGDKYLVDPQLGTYHVYSRSRYTCALPPGGHICWRYMVRFAYGRRGGRIGFHEIPTNTRTGHKLQSVAQLGSALSGGCVRQSTPDAVYVWNWAGVGTKVVVVWQ